MPTSLRTDLTKRLRLFAGGVAVISALLLPPSSADAAGQWSIVSSPNASSNLNTLAGVSCPTTTFCEAVGHYYNGSVDQVLIETWDGTKWAVTHSANTTVSHDNDLIGVSCTSASFCMAAGAYVATDGSVRTLAAQWNGTSRQLLRPRNIGSIDHLRGINCRSTTFCFAVGDYYDGSRWRTLVERWNGSTWSGVASPNAPEGDSFLTGIGCSSTVFCMASGSYANGTADQTLVETWDGVAWRLLNPPNRDSMGDEGLPGVACTKPEFCMAVGASRSSGIDQTLAERWDGTTWNIVTTANTTTFRANYLASVSCRSTAFCIAVGGFYNGSATQPLIEQWNGTTWGLMSPASTGLGNYDLYGVSCSNSINCLAVGSGAPSGRVGRTLVEHWIA